MRMGNNFPGELTVYAAFYSDFPIMQKIRPGKFSRAMAFLPGVRKIKTLCFQRFVFGLPRANSKNRRREDAPRIPLGD